jgi:hypothetical protein
MGGVGWRWVDHGRGGSESAKKDNSGVKSVPVDIDSKGEPRASLAVVLSQLHRTGQANLAPWREAFIWQRTVLSILVQQMQHRASLFQMRERAA